jgi:hypothetical protein
MIRRKFLKKSLIGFTGKPESMKSLVALSLALFSQTQDKIFLL